MRNLHVSDALTPLCAELEPLKIKKEQGALSPGKAGIPEDLHFAASSLGFVGPALFLNIHFFFPCRCLRCSKKWSNVSRLFSYLEGFSYEIEASTAGKARRVAVKPWLALESEPWLWSVNPGGAGRNIEAALPV